MTQLKPRSATGCQQPSRSWQRPVAGSPHSFRRNQLCRHLDLRHLACRAMRQSIPVTSATVCVLCYGSLSKRKHHFSPTFFGRPELSAFKPSSLSCPEVAPTQPSEILLRCRSDPVTPRLKTHGGLSCSVSTGDFEVGQPDVSQPPPDH